ncbi:Peptidyl-prolyl cis-trans isomerase-like 3 [Colletotrichum tanaceti]|uniref:Peptidyl-prolyl cis-trans isomerase n=1 Tax=Colletotrichum tanaceti TaxID=1306861 RepID=A0A4U6XMW0_9PEZI|nr:Peptidyl-prolyl cis-trans isomerase-like 3 [Colletotrichum tanaceti]TKW57012.1 Peptidyl-prolyl cis-trans isomerase-like 3 [Colletotrichum tanaceti]
MTSAEVSTHLHQSKTESHTAPKHRGCLRFGLQSTDTRLVQLQTTTPRVRDPGRQTGNMSVTLHTNLGDLKIEVFCESVPKTAENFLALCASHYYDASPIHRMIPKFMAQTGAPANPSPPENPKGGASIWGGTFEDEIRPALKHSARGVVSMANKGPATNGSQFFVLFDKAPHLDGLNTVFGRVIGDEGMLTLDRIEAVEVDRKNRPKEPVKIERVTVHANPLAG